MRGRDKIAERVGDWRGLTTWLFFEWMMCDWEIVARVEKVVEGVDRVVKGRC
jgi:hypothetical protein